MGKNEENGRVEKWGGEEQEGRRVGGVRKRGGTGNGGMGGKNGMEWEKYEKITGG